MIPPGSIEALPVSPSTLLIIGLGVVGLIAGIGLAIMRQSDTESTDTPSPTQPSTDTPQSQHTDADDQPLWGDSPASDSDSTPPSEQQSELDTESSETPAEATPTGEATSPEVVATPTSSESGRVLDDPAERHKSALAPSYVEEDPDNHEHLQLDRSFTREYFIAEWPERLRAGIMEDYFTQSGLDVDTAIQVDPVDKEQALSDLKSTIGDLRAERDRLNDDGNRTAAKDINRKLQEYETLRDSVRDYGKRMVDVGFYITVEASSLDELDRVSDEVEQKLRDKGFKPVLKKKDQEATHRSASPVPVDEIDMKRSMMDEHVGALFPFVGSTILQEGGIPLGENAQNRTPILYDRFTHGNGYNWLTIGNIGAGKSFSTKTHHVRRRARDDDTILIWLDPLEGFAGPCEALDGQHILVGGNLGLNPLEVEPVSEEKLEANPQLDPGGAKLKDLKSFFTSHWEMRGRDSGLGELWNTLESAIRDAYALQGINLDDPTTFDNPNPTIREHLIPVLLDRIVDVKDNSAVRDLIAGREGYDVEKIMDTEGVEAALDEERRRAVQLLLGMQPFAEGGAMDHLGGESEFNIGEEDIVWLDLQLQEGRDTLGLMMKLLFSSVYERAKTTDKKVIFAIDEARYIMKDKSALSFIEQRTRHSRHHNLSIQLITQTVDEFFQHEEAKYIADNCAHKLIFRTEGLTNEYADLIGMNPAQANFARTAKEGDEERGYSEGVLGISGHGWTPIHISASDTEAAVVDWEPGQPASELPGMNDVDEIPPQVEELTRQISEQYSETIQTRVHKTEGIPEVVFTDADGDEVAVVDRERIFNADGTFAEIADELDVEIEAVENEVPVPDGGQDTHDADSDRSPVDWTAVPYVDDVTAANLSTAGYTTLESIREATDAELEAVDGVGPAIVSNLREYSRAG